jgi:ABC-2 type transport system ATP-binding protein
VTNAPVIETESLVKKYGDLTAVDGLTLSIPSGQVFSLLGPNGAGKTVTVEMLEGLRRPTSGTARVFGQDVTHDYMAIRKRVGVLPQDFDPFDRLNAVEAVTYWADLFSKRVTKADIRGLLDDVGLAERSKTQAISLSGGEKRKVGLAMALIGDPELVFLDEPTTGLDPKARRDLWGLIDGVRSKGHTVFLTTHYLDEAERLADDVAIMHKGRVIRRGSPEQLVANHGSGAALVLAGAGSGALEEVHAMGLTAVLDGDDVVISPGPDGGVKRVLPLLADLKSPVQDIFTRRKTLEDVFMEVVGGRMEEGVVHE